MATIILTCLVREVVIMVRCELFSQELHIREKNAPGNEDRNKKFKKNEGKLA